MAENILSTIIKLRRDNDYNYAKVKDTFIPANGEPILVDTVSDGLRVKIGNGFNTYSQLEFIDDIFLRGYLYEGVFYEDSTHSVIIQGFTTKFYIDKSNNRLYRYDGESYIPIVGSPTASSSIAGIMKLYQTTGQNVDGTMSQKAITDELQSKFEVNIDSSEEMIIFS